MIRSPHASRLLPGFALALGLALVAGACKPSPVTPTEKSSTTKGSQVFITTDPMSTWAPHGYPGTALNDVEFLGRGIFVAVGTDGDIVRSTDEGASWRLVPSGTTMHLRSVTRVSIDVLVAVGFNGAIVRSTDVGNTWRSVTTGSTADLCGVTTAGNVVVAVGSSTILRSIDSGATWTRVEPSPFTTLTEIAVGTRDTLYAVGYEGVVLRSVDSGASWIRLPVPGLDNQDWLKGLYCPGPGTVLVGGYRYEAGTENSVGRIARTVDGGANWTIDSVHVRETSMHAISGYGTTAVAVGKNGVSYRSTDNGATWSRSSWKQDGSWMYGVVMYAPNRAIAVGTYQ